MQMSITTVVYCRPMHCECDGCFGAFWTARVVEACLHLKYHLHSGTNLILDSQSFTPLKYTFININSKADLCLVDARYSIFIRSENCMNKQHATMHTMI